VHCIPIKQERQVPLEESASHNQSSTARVRSTFRPPELLLHHPPPPPVGGTHDMCGDLLIPSVLACPPFPTKQASEQHAPPWLAAPHHPHSNPPLHAPHLAAERSQQNPLRRPRRRYPRPRPTADSPEPSPTLPRPHPVHLRGAMHAVCRRGRVGKHQPVSHNSPRLFEFLVASLV
jgi:hypothetical protein